jgi:hypothetical protein
MIRVDATQYTRRYRRLIKYRLEGQAEGLPASAIRQYYGNYGWDCAVNRERGSAGED